MAAIVSLRTAQQTPTLTNINKESVMTKLKTTIGSIAVASTLMIASLATSVQAGELSSQAKQNLFDALGQVVTSQVDSLITEINYDIERSISQSLLNFGQPEQPKNAKVTITYMHTDIDTAASKKQ